MCFWVDDAVHVGFVRVIGAWHKGQRIDAINCEVDCCRTAGVFPNECCALKFEVFEFDIVPFVCVAKFVLIDVRRGGSAFLNYLVCNTDVLPRLITVPAISCRLDT